MKRIMNERAGNGRSDDNEATIRNRLVVYKEQSLPVVEQYEGLGKVVRVSDILYCIIISVLLCLFGR